MLVCQQSGNFDDSIYTGQLFNCFNYEMCPVISYKLWLSLHRNNYQHSFLCSPQMLADVLNPFYWCLWLYHDVCNSSHVVLLNCWSISLSLIKLHCNHSIITHFYCVIRVQLWVSCLVRVSCQDNMTIFRYKNFINKYIMIQLSLQMKKNNQISCFDFVN